MCPPRESTVLTVNSAILSPDATLSSRWKGFSKDSKTKSNEERKFAAALLSLRWEATAAVVALRHQQTFK